MRKGPVWDFHLTTLYLCTMMSLQAGDLGDSGRMAGPGAVLGSIAVGQELFQTLSPNMFPKQHFSHLPLSSYDLF